MDLSFFSRPPGLWLATLGVAALLLALGYEAAQQSLSPALEAARQELAVQTSRANQLAAENQRLEARLAQAQARLETGRASGREDNGPGEAEEARQRVLHRGEALMLLEGRVSVTLEALLTGPRRAVVRVKVAGGDEQTRVLAVGQDLRLGLGQGQSLNLVLKRVLASSVVIWLGPLRN